MTNNILLVDDLRVFRREDDPRYVSLYTARTSDDALKILQQSPRKWVQIWLDHDLGMVDGQEDTIMPVVDYLCESAYSGYPVPVELILVHTSNPVGRDRICKVLSNRGYNVMPVNAHEHFDIDEDLYFNALKLEDYPN